MLIFCSSFLVGLLHDFKILYTDVPIFFSLEIMTSWKFRSIENPALQYALQRAADDA